MINSRQHTELLTGLVIARYGETVTIEDINNISYDYIVCNLRKSLEPITVGDYVKYEINPDNNYNNSKHTGIVTKLLPRKSVIYKNIDHSPNYQKKSKSDLNNLKPIAANLDQILIISAIEPIPSSYLIDQFLIISELNNIKPIIILNKSDLINNNNKDLINNLINIYKNIGYEVYLINSFHTKDIYNLYKILENKNNILVGPSGVGKSTITQQLLPDFANLKINIKTSEISSKTKLGKHTTTVAKLYHIDNNNTNLIDSPGIREINITHIDPKILETCYPEIKKYSVNCKFKDCMHYKEPHCCVKEALNNNLINKERWDNFKKLSYK